MSSTISEVASAPGAAAVAAVRVEPPKTTGATSSASATPATPQQVQAAVDTLNEHFSTYRSDLKFKVERDIGVLVVSVVDSGSGEVLMQLPSEQALQTAREVRRGNAQGLLSTTA